MFSNAEAIYFNIHTHTHTHTDRFPICFIFLFFFLLARRLAVVVSVKILDSCVRFRTLLLSLVRSFEHQYYCHRIYRGRCISLSICSYVSVKYYECATVCQSVCAHIAEHTLIRSTCTCVCAMIFGLCVASALSWI